MVNIIRKIFILERRIRLPLSLAFAFPFVRTKPIIRKLWSSIRRTHSADAFRLREASPPTVSKVIVEVMVITYGRCRDQAGPRQFEELGVDVTEYTSELGVGWVDEAEFEFDRPRGLGVCSCRDDVQSEWL